MNSTIGRSVLLGMGLTNPNNNRDQTVDTLSGHFLCGVAASPRVLAGSALFFREIVRVLEHLVYPMSG